MNNRMLAFLFTCSALPIFGCEKKSEYLECMDKVSEAYEACHTSGGDNLTCLNGQVDGTRYCSDNYEVSNNNEGDVEIKQTPDLTQEDLRVVRYLETLNSFTFRPGRSVSSDALGRFRDLEQQAILIPFVKRTELDSEKFWTDEELAAVNRNVEVATSQILRSHFLWKAPESDAEIIEYDSETGQALITSPLQRHWRFDDGSICKAPSKTRFFEIEFVRNVGPKQLLSGQKIVTIKIGQMSDSIGMNPKEIGYSNMAVTVPMSREIGREIIENPNVYLQWHLAFKMDGADKYSYETCQQYSSSSGTTHHSNHIVNATLAYATLVAVQRGEIHYGPPHSRQVLASWASDNYVQGFLRNDLEDYLSLFGYLGRKDAKISDDELAVAISKYQANKNISLGDRVIDAAVVALLLEDQFYMVFESDEVFGPNRRFEEVQIGPIEAVLPLDVN